MSGINGLGNKNVEEYTKFGDKIIAENTEIMKKSGLPVTVFNQDLKLNNPIAGSPQKYTDNQEDNNKVDDKNDKNDKPKETLFEETSVAKNKTMSSLKVPNGILNTAYRKGLQENAMLGDTDDTDAVKMEELLSSLEETNGNDDNNDLEDFMATEYKNGLHLNGGGYTYYENGTDSSIQSISANLSGSYKNKNEKLSLSYGGMFEYSDKIQKQEDSHDKEKCGSAILMAKYKANKVTFAGGGMANIYDSNSGLYNIYVGAMHNSTGLAVTLTRKIQLAYDAEGEKVLNNETSVNVNILKPKQAGDFPNTIPDIPTPEETQQYDSLVESNKQEVKDITNDNTKPSGLELDLELSTSEGSDEYGVVIKHCFTHNSKDKQKFASLTPYIGAYDYHPDTQEGLKVRAGVEGDLDITTDNNTNIHTTAIIDNKRIMQSGSSPINTFMAVLDTSLNKNKLSANVSAGYINSGSDIKYSFVTGKLTYNMKNSSLAVVAGYQDCDLPSGDDKIFHTGLRYALTF